MGKMTTKYRVNDIPSCFWDALHEWRRATNAEDADFETRHGGLPRQGEPGPESLALRAAQDAATDKLIRIMGAFWLDRDPLDRLLNVWGEDCGEEGCHYCADRGGRG
jgi:hypothetical protein